MRYRFVLFAFLFILTITNCFSQGTYLVKDIHPGTASSTPNNFAKAGNVFYFNGITTDFQFGLFKTDGTDAGTSLVSEELWPQAYDTIRAKNVTDYNGKLGFVNSNYTTGYNELLVTDGTIAGTIKVAQLPFSSNNKIELLTVFNNCLYYTLRTTDINTIGLYKWDGTNSPLRLLDLYTVSTVSVCQLIVGGNKLFFVDGNTIYDVTTDTPAILYDNSSGSTLIGKTYYYNGKLLFTEYYFSTTTLSNIPYGIRVLDPVLKTYFDISTTVGFINQYYNIYYPTVVEMNDTLYFINEGYLPYFIRLYKIDPQFTLSMVIEIPRNQPLFMGTMLVNDQKIIFTIESPDINNNELWVSDGTNAGTFPLITIDDSIEVAHRQNKFVLLDNKLFFQARDIGTSNFNSPHGAELWTSDFTKAGTKLAVDFCQGEGFGVGHSGFIKFNNTSLMLCAYRCSDMDGASYGRELWITDGTSFNDVTSIKESSDYHPAIYPNPATDHITVEGIIGNAIVYIYNFYGELISETKIHLPKSSIELPSHASGSYFIRIKEGEKIFTTKINTY